MELNEESAAAKEAHRRGLTYGGFSQWVDASRQVRGKTVDGQFVPVGPESAGQQQAKGPIAVIDVDTDLFRLPSENSVVRRYLSFLEKLLKRQVSLVLLLPKDLIERAAELLSQFDNLNQSKVVPYTKADPSVKAGFVAKLIKSGYARVYFFDDDQQTIQAVNALKAKGHVETGFLPSIKTLMSREHQ